MHVQPAFISRQRGPAGKWSTGAGGSALIHCRITNSIAGIQKKTSGN